MNSYYNRLLVNSKEAIDCSYTFDIISRCEEKILKFKIGKVVHWGYFKYGLKIIIKTYRQYY